MVAKEDTLPDVLNAFYEWLVDLKLIDNDCSIKSRFTFVTCGDWDLGVILPNEANYRKLLLPKYVCPFMIFLKQQNLCWKNSMKSLRSLQCVLRFRYFKSWINLKKAFCKSRGYFAKSMTVMLQDLELKHLVCFFWHYVHFLNRNSKKNRYVIAFFSYFRQSL